MSSVETQVGDLPNSNVRSRRIYGLLVSLVGLIVILQGLWAGVFLQRDGRREDEATWITVHARGGEIAIAISAVAALLAWTRLRSNRRLCICSTALTLLLIVEAYIGGEIRNSGAFALTIVHVPLAMVILALVIWLPLSTRTKRHLDR